MNRIMRMLFWFVCPFLLGSLTSCVEGRSVTVVLAQNHPWESVAGRRFWYTLAYNGAEDGLHTVQLSIGQRKVNLLVAPGQTVVFAAYPLGQGIPLGGATHAIDSHEDVELTAKDGQLADMLLSLAKTWPLPVATVNFDYISAQIGFLSFSGLGIDWHRLAKDIVEGNLNERSVQPLAPRTLFLSDIPQGRWVCERNWYADLCVYSDTTAVLENAFPGMLRFLNLELSLELRIVISEDEEEGTYWHIVPMDPLLLLSDATYQQLLEHVDGFT